MLQENLTPRFFHIVVSPAFLFLLAYLQRSITFPLPFRNLLLFGLILSLRGIVKRLFSTHDHHLLNFVDAGENNVERSIKGLFKRRVTWMKVYRRHYMSY
jgi:hypothetical protein